MHAILPTQLVACPTSAELIDDILSHIQVNPQGQVFHRHYAPVPISDDFQARLEQMSADVRRRYLMMQISNFLYGFYFMGIKPMAESDGEESDSTPSTTPLSTRPLLNNSYHGLDAAFYQRLQQSNRGTGYWHRGWEVLSTEGQNGEWMVQQQGLTLMVQPHWQVSTAEQQAGVGDRISLRLPPQQVEPDDYIAIGNRGLPSLVPASSQGLGTNSSDYPIELFFHLQPEAAAPLIEAVSQTLNDRHQPFRLAVLNRPNLYEGRPDAGRLQLTRQGYEANQAWIKALARSLSLNPETWPLTQPLLPGLSLAEVPRWRASGASGFGLYRPLFAQHRCEAIASGLVQALSSPPTHAETTAATPSSEKQHRTEALRAAFEQFEIDWTYPYLNISQS